MAPLYVHVRPLPELLVSVQLETARSDECVTSAIYTTPEGVEVDVWPLLRDLRISDIASAGRGQHVETALIEAWYAKFSEICG